MADHNRSGRPNGSSSPRYSSRYGAGRPNPYMGGQPKSDSYLKDLENRREAEQLLSQAEDERRRIAERSQPANSRPPEAQKPSEPPRRPDRQRSEPPRRPETQKRHGGAEPKEPQRAVSNEPQRAAPSEPQRATPSRRRTFSEPRALRDEEMRRRLREIQKSAAAEAAGMLDPFEDDEQLPPDVKMRLSDDGKPLIALDMKDGEGRSHVRWVPVELNEEDMSVFFPAMEGKAQLQDRHIDMTPSGRANDLPTDDGLILIPIAGLDGSDEAEPTEAEPVLIPIAGLDEPEDKPEPVPPVVPSMAAPDAPAVGFSAVTEIIDGLPTISSRNEADPVAPPESEVFAPAEPEEVIPDEPEEVIPNEPEDDTLIEPEEVVPVEPEDNIPPEPEENIPPDPEDDATAEPEENTPTESEEDIPDEPEDNTPPEPEDDTPDEPEDDSPTEPEYNAPTEPEEVIPDEPEYDAPAEPETDFAPEPEEVSPTEPEEYVPFEPEDEIPDEPEEYTPFEPEQHTSRKPDGRVIPAVLPSEETDEDDSDMRVASPRPAPRRTVGGRPKYDELNTGTRFTQPKYAKGEQEQDDSLFIRKERPGSTALFLLPDGVKMPKYIDDDEFVEQWLNEGEAEDMIIQDKKKRRRISAIIGAVTMVLALVGLIAVARWGIGLVGSIGNTDSQKDEYAEFIAPIVMSEVPVFETWDAIPQEKLLQSAVFYVLLNMDETAYAEDDTAKLIVPSADMINAVRTLYGAHSDDPVQDEEIVNFIRNTLFTSAGENIPNADAYYVDLEDSFHVVNGVGGPSARVTEIGRRDNQITLTVEYLEDLEGGGGTTLYTRQFILTKTETGYFVRAIRELAK